MEQIDHIIFRYLNREISPEEEVTLLEWLEEHPENGRYFRMLKDAYDLGQLENSLSESQTRQQWDAFKNKVFNERNRRHKRKVRPAILSFVKYAAVFLLGFICFQTIIYFTQNEESQATGRTIVETNIGERSGITLPDSSRIWINACTQLAYDRTYGNGNREVYLKGEAYFEVNADPQRPFLVHTGGIIYKALGTSFNVYSFEDENETNISLLEGKVAIEYGGRMEELQPGEMFIYNKLTGACTRETADVNRISSWRTGELIFDNITFEELARRLERLFNVRFVFQNEHISKEAFGGSFHDRESLETIMKVIGTSIPVKYKIRENVIYVE